MASISSSSLVHEDIDNLYLIPVNANRGLLLEPRPRTGVCTHPPRGAYLRPILHRIASPYQILRALEHGSESNPNYRSQNHSTGAYKLFYSPSYGAVSRCSAPFTFETDVEPHQPNSFAFKVRYKTHWDFGLEKEGLARRLHNMHHMDPLGAPVNFNLTSKLGFAEPEMWLLESICGWAWECPLSQ